MRHISRDWSRDAIAVAQYLVRASKNGTKLDPQATVAGTALATRLAHDDVWLAVVELEEQGLIERSREISTGEIGTRRFWPTIALFVEFDSHFLGFDTELDALKTVHWLVLNQIRVIETAKLAEHFPEWSKRQLNSALNYLAINNIVDAVHTIGEAPWTMGHVMVTDRTRLFVRDHPIDWKARFEQFEQEPLGAKFEPDEDHLVIAASGHAADRDAAANPVTRQLHEQVKLKASELASCAMRLANQPGWHGLAGTSERFSRLVHTDIEQVADHIGEVWGELVSLGSFLEQDDELRQAEGGFSGRLEPEQRRPLADLLQTAGPWVRLFPTARTIDEEHASFQAPREQIEPARALVAAAQKEKVIRKADADLLDTALSGGEHSGHQSQKARSFGIFSTQNFIFRATTLVVTGLVLGVSQQVGKEAAKDLVLANKAVRMIVSAEEPLLRFLSVLPADIRAAVRDLIDKLKAARENPNFPLPQPPKPEPVRERRREEDKL